jgi:uncharacterized protein (TIRG00374 family)
MAFKLILKQLSKFIPLVGIILLIYIIYDIGIQDIIHSFSLISPLFFILAAIFTIPRLFIASYKWKYLLKKQKIEVSIFNVLKIYLIGIFYGSLTPGGFGLHIRIYYLKKLINPSFEKCIASSFIDGTIRILSGLFLAIIGSILFISTYPEIFPVVLVFLIFYLTVFIFFMEKKRGGKFLNFFIKPFLPDKYKVNMKDSIDLLYEDLPRLRDTIIPFLVDIIIFFIAAVQTYVIALGLNINIPIFDFLIISITSVVISSVIPITIGGLGVREGFFVLMLSVYGISSDIAIVISLAGFLVKIVIPGIIGLIYSTTSSFKYVKEEIY